MQIGQIIQTAEKQYELLRNRESRFGGVNFVGVKVTNSNRIEVNDQQVWLFNTDLRDARFHNGDSNV